MAPPSGFLPYGMFRESLDGRKALGGDGSEMRLRRPELMGETSYQEIESGQARAGARSASHVVQRCSPGPSTAVKSRLAPLSRRARTRAAFSFKSAFILAGAVLLGTVVIPYAASLAGAPVNITVMVALPLLIAAARAGPYAEYAQ